MRPSQNKIGKASPDKAAVRKPALRYEHLKNHFVTLWYLGISALVVFVRGEFKVVVTIAVVSYFVLSIMVAWLGKGGRTSARARREAEEEPPRCLLIIAAFFLPAVTRHAALGDMEETYRNDVEDVGVKAARWLMVRDVLVSILSALKGLPRALLVIALKAVGIYELYRRFIGK